MAKPCGVNTGHTCLGANSVGDGFKSCINGRAANASRPMKEIDFRDLGKAKLAKNFLSGKSSKLATFVLSEIKRRHGKYPIRSISAKYPEFNAAIESSWGCSQKQNTSVRKPGRARKAQKVLTTSINDLPVLSRRVYSVGTEGKKNGAKGISKRKGSKATIVVYQHNDDQDIMAKIFGKKNVKIEEDYVDITIHSIPEIREYKPDVNSGDLHQAMGELFMASDVYKERHGKVPRLVFSTRRRLNLKDIASFTKRGIRVEYLTKENTLVRAA